jgi:titin
MIVFDATVFPPGNPATITLASGLPPINQDGITIDASDSGVILDGQDLDIAGIAIRSDGNTIRGLQVYRCGGAGIEVFGDWNVIGGNRSMGSGPVGQGNVLGENGLGVKVWESSHNLISGNLIGTDVTGRSARGNVDHGISVRAGHDNLIGGSKPGERNIISANGGPGIALGPGVGTSENSYENRVIGNYIGTDISGSVALGNGETGIVADLGPFGNLIKGNIVCGSPLEGILIGDPGACYNTVVGNIVGLDASGTRPMGNSIGISVGWTPPCFNRVGGISPEDKNIVSGNVDGIHIAGDGHFVLGNYVGTDMSRNVAVGNDIGIIISQVDHTFVGGTRSEERNVIVGSVQSGIAVRVAHNNFVTGNYIGVGPTGAIPLQNGRAVSFESASLNVFQNNVISGNYEGVVVQEGSEKNLLRANRIGVAAEDDTPVPNGEAGVCIESASNQIGGPYPDDGNVIANNNGGGVQVRTESGNTILGNSIYRNRGWGIRLENGANGSISAPETTRIGSFTVRGTTCPGCTVDIFADKEDQGRVFEGRSRADGAGSFEFTLTGWRSRPCVTSTATDGDGNTSEFSEPTCVPQRREVGRRVGP